MDGVALLMKFLHIDHRMVSFSRFAKLEQMLGLNPRSRRGPWLVGLFHRVCPPVKRVEYWNCSLRKRMKKIHHSCVEVGVLTTFGSLVHS